MPPSIKHTHTYSFDHEQVLQLIAGCLNETYGLSIEPKDLKVDIKDSMSPSSNWHDDSKKARIVSISYSMDEVE